MSVYYGLHCKTCDSALNVRCRKEIDAMRWLLKHATAVAQAWLLFENAPYPLTFHLGLSDADERIDAVWLGVHQAHELVVIDEFGNEHP